jgi:nucleotide-binding universal stress UspA family protein
MSHRFASILLPLDGSPESAKAAGCALWLAQALGATLHVVHATAHSLPAAGALARLRVPHVQDARVVVHQVAGGAEAAVLQEIAAHHIDLVVMSARGESASAKLAPMRRLGSIAQAVIERSPVPIVLLPLHYRESLPWTSMLAAASGEASADHALEAAARLATALRLKITVVHSADGPRGTGAAPFGGYADAPHHEYSHRLKQLVERGLAGCAAEEAHCVHDVLLCRGEPGAVLLEQVAGHGSSVLALGWHGALGAGRALVLKCLLEQAECALLVVRGAEHSRARLKVGSAIDQV